MNTMDIILILAPFIVIIIAIFTHTKMSTKSNNIIREEKTKGVNYINQYIFPDNNEKTNILEHTIIHDDTQYIIIERPSGKYRLTIYTTSQGDYYKLEEITPIFIKPPNE